MHEDMDGVEKEPEKELVRPKMTGGNKGVLKQNREFLDFFWDIAKPDRDIRLKAIEGLIEYLKKTEKVNLLTLALCATSLTLPEVCVTQFPLLSYHLTCISCGKRLFIGISWY